MTFLSPWFLLLLIPLAGLTVAAVLLRRRRDRFAVRFASLPLLDQVVPERPGWRRHLTSGLGLLSLSFLVLAAARPEADIRVPREQATVMIAVDQSISMRATDVDPSRLEAAIAAGSSFVDELPEAFRVGLVGFAGDAQVLAAPTNDRQAVKDALSRLSLEPMTAIGEGVFTSLDQVRATEELQVPARIVLLSDGTNTTGRSPEEAASAASAAGVPVSTIAYGTPDGVIENGNGPGIRVPVDAAALAALAEATGGTAYEAESSDELREVYEDIGSSIGWISEPRELAPYFAAAAFLCTLIAAALSLRWFARLV
ncbi:VWA domain-containing protein [Kineosporia babensis]|uniref:VWA domain-containing protein n=1 Tax=Kineosporia babensis TaxID=499548 RepID=A0A9X1SY67_9ACTN|nr:VWA domain-containing protein [Kineosporia babensis]MCD5316000.1 VWA domain-containing protein [Kineosporia babensis]